MRTLGLEKVGRSNVVANQTAGSGTGWVSLEYYDGATIASATCAQIWVLNTTGTTLEFGYGAAGDSAPSGATFALVDGAEFTFRGLRDTRHLLVRRLDQDATQVDVFGIAEAV